MSATRIKSFIQDAMLILRSFAVYLSHGRADASSSSPTSVVIIQRAKLGDMIVTTPMFRAVKRAYPACKVTVVGSAGNKETLFGNPDIDDYLVWENDVNKMIEVFKRGNYDFGCLTSPNFHSLAALYCAGIKSVAGPYITGGWSPYETKAYRILLRLVHQIEHRMGHYVPRENLRLLRPIGIESEDTKKYVYWSGEAEKKARDFLSALSPHSMLVGIMPGAGNKIKQWPAERFAQVADYLIEKYDAHILIFGSPANKEEIETMKRNAAHPERISDCSWPNIDELKALVSKVGMTVSVDTGPIFIAEATGVPTIDIAGSIHPNEMAPNDGQFHLLVQSGGKPEIWTMNARVLDYDKARKQIERITVSMVTEKIDELIEKIRNRSSIGN